MPSGMLSSGSVCFIVVISLLLSLVPGRLKYIFGVKIGNEHSNKIKNNNSASTS